MSFRRVFALSLLIAAGAAQAQTPSQPPNAATPAVSPTAPSQQTAPAPAEAMQKPEPAPVGVVLGDAKAGQGKATACGACHGIGGGDSPVKDAPAFRTLGKRYPVENLEEALGEGFMSGHPAMPEFTFDGDDVGDIIAYLKSIQR